MQRLDQLELAGRHRGERSGAPLGGQSACDRALCRTPCARPCPCPYLWPSLLASLGPLGDRRNQPVSSPCTTCGGERARRALKRAIESSSRVHALARARQGASCRGSARSAVTPSNSAAGRRFASFAKCGSEQACALVDHCDLLPLFFLHRREGELPEPDLYALSPTSQRADPALFFFCSTALTVSGHNSSQKV